MAKGKPQKEIKGLGGDLKKDFEREIGAFNLRGDETLIQFINL